MRNQPKSVRVRYAAIYSMIITGFISAIWLVTLPSKFTALDNLNGVQSGEMNTDTKNPSTFRKITRDFQASFSEAFDDALFLFEDEEDVLLATESEESTIATENNLNLNMMLASARSATGTVARRSRPNTDSLVSDSANNEPINTTDDTVSQDMGTETQIQTVSVNEVSVRPVRLVTVSGNEHMSADSVVKEEGDGLLGEDMNTIDVDINDYAELSGGRNTGSGTLLDVLWQPNFKSCDILTDINKHFCKLLITNYYAEKDASIE